jgi:hypothetical protein
MEIPLVTEILNKFFFFPFMFATMFSIRETLAPRCPDAARPHVRMSLRLPTRLRYFMWGPVPFCFPRICMPMWGPHLDLCPHCFSRLPPRPSTPMSMHAGPAVAGGLRQMGPTATCVTLDLLLQHLDETIITYILTVKILATYV